jgi:hypothetical protein
MMKRHTVVNAASTGHCSCGAVTVTAQLRRAAAHVSSLLWVVWSVIVAAAACVMLCCQPSCAVLHRCAGLCRAVVCREGCLKIADFGLARNWHIEQNGKLTNRVITLWYRWGTGAAAALGGGGAAAAAAAAAASSADGIVLNMVRAAFLRIA